MPLLTKTQGPESIAWSIGGAPVTMQWDSCRMTAPGGYEGVRGQVTGALQRRKLRQGAEIKGVRPNGKILYQGTLVSTPKVINGVAYVEAEGYQAVVRRHNERLPYIIGDSSQWSGANELPFDYSVNQKFTMASKNDSIGWTINQTETYAVDERAGYGLFVPDYAVQRIKCTMRKSSDTNDFELYFRGANNLGALTLRGNRSLAAANPDGSAFSVTIGGPDQDTVVVALWCTAAVTPANTKRVWLQDLVACVIADDDNWATSEVVSDVAARLNFADDVTATGTEIGVLDWNGGWDELLNYMAAIEDWTWLVIDDRTKGPKTDAQLTFRPWGHKTWQTSLNTASENLTVAPLYNRVTVFYERPEGVPQHKTFDPADFDLDDPIPGLHYEYPDPPVLENPQRNLKLVNNIAERLLTRVTKTRLVGSIKVAALTKGVPFDIQAGDLLNIPDYDPKVGPQRISAVTYNADGTADLSLERSFDIAAMLFRLTAHRRRTSPHSFGSGHRS